MARPRKNDPSALLNSIVHDFTSQLSTVIEKFTTDRVTAAMRTSGSVKVAKKKGVGSRRGKLCYYPACKNVAAPRFGMFCAALHKDLPKPAKERYRAAHAGS